jgi:hypothetical protein
LKLTKQSKVIEAPPMVRVLRTDHVNRPVVNRDHRGDEEARDAAVKVGFRNETTMNEEAGAEGIDQKETEDACREEEIVLAPTVLLLVENVPVFN